MQPLMTKEHKTSTNDVRIPLQEPGLDVNPGQLTHCGEKQVLFTQARVASVDYNLR